MRALGRRLHKLEDHFWPADGKRRRILLIACKAGFGLALDRDTCIQILDECGHLPTDQVGLVNLSDIPERLNAKELERHLQEKFATYTRDSASGLDYAMNRYFNSVSGRVMSADPYRSSLDRTEPGSLNRYGYAWSDSINSNDPTGLCIIAGEEYPDPCFSVTTFDVFGGGSGGGTSQPTKGSPTDPPTLTSREVIFRAEQLASKWLSNQSCSKLFNLSGQGFNPSQVLGNLTSSGIFQSGSTQIRLFGANFGFFGLDSTVVGGFTLNNVSLTGVGLGADIIVNTNIPTYADPDDTAAMITDTAETLLEELGHAYNMVNGAGGSLVVYDNPLFSGTYIDPLTGKPVSAGLYNQNLIFRNCDK